MRGLWVATAVWTVLLCAAGARAQGEPTEAELQEARALFVAGQAAVESGRWADAVERFSRAYELSGVPTALYNVAYALRSLGRHRESRDAFRRLMAEHPDLDDATRSEAERSLAEVEARVAVVSVQGLDEGTRYTVRFDGRRIEDDGSRPLRIDADPGEHTLTIRSPETEPFVWEGTLGDGEAMTVEAELTPVSIGGGGGVGAGAGAGSGGTGPTDDGGSFLSSPWLWIAVGVVLLAAGAGVAYLLYQDAQLDPNSDRVYEL